VQRARSVETGPAPCHGAPRFSCAPTRGPRATSGPPAVADEKTETTANPVVFWELASHDAEKSIAFFEAIFDWEFNAPPDSPLSVARTSTEQGGVNGGIFTLGKAKLPFLTVYVLVDDIVGKAELVKENGGLVIEEPHEIPGGSWICLFNDPSGATFAMLEQKKASPDEEEPEAQ